MNESNKIIFHIDVNSAFLSWTAAYRLKVLGEETDLRNIPSAICGSTETRHGIILAKSGPAKAYGIKTGEPLYLAKRKCPQLVTAPPDYALYTDASRKFIELLKELAPVVEQYSIDEAWADMTGTEKLYGPPVLAAEKIKDRIREQLGFTVNIGISCNKLLAKMASEFEKPDKVHTLFPDEIAVKLWPLPVGELFMVGRASCRKLQSMGITTIGQLAAADPRQLKLHLHKQGEMIWNFANGRWDQQVSDEVSLNKGYGNSLTTSRNVCDTDKAKTIILSLCETLAMRIRRDNQLCSCVSLHIRKDDFSSISQQKQLSRPTDATMEIYHAACRILDLLWDGHTPLRQIGVYLSKVEQNCGRQISLFSTDNYEQLAKTDKAIDSIRARFGEEAIMRACFLRAEVSPMSGGLSKQRRTGITKITDPPSD